MLWPYRMAVFAQARTANSCPSDSCRVLPQLSSGRQVALWGLLWQRLRRQHGTAADTGLAGQAHLDPRSSLSMLTSQGPRGQEAEILEGSSQKQRPCRSSTTSNSWPACTRRSGLLLQLLENLALTTAVELLGEVLPATLGSKWVVRPPGCCPRQ